VLSGIKFAGVTIAAIWFGGTLFFTFFIAPAFFVDPIKTLLPPPYNGQVAQYILQRYYALHYVCGVLALLHLGFDWIYTGKVMQRRNLAAALGVLILALVAGKYMHPKIEGLYRIKYAEHYQVEATPEKKAEVERSFKIWHGISQGANLLILLVLWFYLWQMMHPKEGPRYLGSGKFNIDNPY